MKTIIPSLSSPPSELVDKPKNGAPRPWRGCDGSYPGRAASCDLETVASTSKRSPCKICMDIDQQHTQALKSRRPVQDPEKRKEVTEFREIKGVKDIKEVSDINEVKEIKGVNEDKEGKQAENMNFTRPIVIGDLEWRRPCGCLKTSDKLKELLKCFPVPPPPPPPPFTSPVSHNSQATSPLGGCSRNEKMCIASCCTVKRPLDTLKPICSSMPPPPLPPKEEKAKVVAETSTKEGRAQLPKRILTELIQLLQVIVTATALALYYIIYFYMQLVYFMLRSAVFFHNADGPMKITIGVVTVTSLIICFNLVLRLEKMVGMRLGEWWE